MVTRFQCLFSFLSPVSMLPLVLLDSFGVLQVLQGAGHGGWRGTLIRVPLRSVPSPILRRGDAEYT